MISEFSIKSKGKDGEGGGDDDSDVILIIKNLIVINFILQLFSYCSLFSSLQNFIMCVYIQRSSRLVDNISLLPPWNAYPVDTCSLHVNAARRGLY